MSPLPFDPDDPPDDPPAEVRQLMLWRLAVGLFRDHQPGRVSAGSPGFCRLCGAPWPCLVRRTAQRGLLAALRDPPAARRGYWFGGPSSRTDPPVSGADPSVRGDGGPPVPPVLPG